MLADSVGGGQKGRMQTNKKTLTKGDKFGLHWVSGEGPIDKEDIENGSGTFVWVFGPYQKKIILRDRLKFKVGRRGTSKE